MRLEFDSVSSVREHARRVQNIEYSGMYRWGPATRGGLVGLFNSICPECGETVQNSETYRCLRCGTQACKGHLKPVDYVKKGIFNDKNIVKYHCARCDNVYNEIAK